MTNLRLCMKADRYMFWFMVAFVAFLGYAHGAATDSVLAVTV